MSEDRIIDKIRKLLNLANNDAATEGERDNALRMAYNLIAKHNLDMSDIKDQPEEQRQDFAEVFYGRPWARQVCSGIAKLFFCSYYYGRTGSSNLAKHHFVGRISNSVTATELAMFLVASIKREAGKQARAQGLGADWRRSFCLGASSRLLSRIHDLRKEKEVETSKGSTGTSLVLADYYRVESDLNEGFIKSTGVNLVVRSDRSKGSTSQRAFGMGSEYAKKLPLTASVESKDSTKRLSFTN